MGRMLGRGISASALPYVRKPIKSKTMSPSEIIDLIVKYAKKGLTESQIGVMLRDQYCVN